MLNTIEPLESRIVPAMAGLTMGSNSIATYSVIAAALVATVIGLAWIFTGDQPSVIAAIPQSKQPSPVAEQINREAPQPSAIPANPVAETPAQAAQKFKSFARHTSLQVVNPNTLGLARPVVELLQLNPTQAEEVDESIRKFTRQLRSQELAHAYINVAANGSEEIVVSAFDKTPLIDELQKEVSKNVDPDVAALIAERIPFDYSLGVTNSEMRLSIGTGDDNVDRVSFTRSVLTPNAVDENTPITVQGPVPGSIVHFSPTDIITTTTPVGIDLDPRYTHLFGAANTLPRRETK